MITKGNTNSGNRFCYAHNERNGRNGRNGQQLTYIENSNNLDLQKARDNKTAVLHHLKSPFNIVYKHLL